MRRIPLAGAPDLLGRARRTTLVRATLGCALAGVFAAATWHAAALGPDPGPIVRPGFKTMLVLDVSTSIRPRLYRQIDATLTAAIRAGGRLGLIVFSDTAYELLAPDTSAQELEGIVRFYRPVPSNPAHVGSELVLGRQSYLQAPWTQTLSSGTRISSGLQLARLTLQRDGRGRGAVVLLSDLGDEVGDLAEFGAEAKLIADEGMQLRIVALSPKPSDLKVARALLTDRRGKIVEAAEPGAKRTRILAGGSTLPIGILALGGTLLLLLALNEVACARLVLRPGEGAP